jgi:predicted TIM-barrel fold metal-dependent hydrolase
LKVCDGGKPVTATPWGELEIADAHLHFFSPAFFNTIAEQKGVSDVSAMLGWDFPESPEDLADRWTVELNRNGVDNAILIASIHGDVESVGYAVERHPDRFRSVVMINPLLPGADHRCQAALSEGLMNGIFLFPAMHGFSLHDTHVRSLLSILSGHPGAVVYVHCGMLSVGFRKKLGLPCRFDMRYSNPVDLHSIALDFPRLPFIIPHFGAGYFREALMVADLCPNIYFDTSSSNRWMQCAPSVTDLANVFDKALQVLGPKRLLFGTDSSWFPRGWIKGIYEAQVDALLAARVDADAARAILGGNLRTLFGFSK